TSVPSSATSTTFTLVEPTSIPTACTAHTVGGPPLPVLCPGTEGAPSFPGHRTGSGRGGEVTWPGPRGGWEHRRSRQTEDLASPKTPWCSGRRARTPAGPKGPKGRLGRWTLPAPRPFGRGGASAARRSDPPGQRKGGADMENPRPEKVAVV